MEEILRGEGESGEGSPSNGKETQMKLNIHLALGLILPWTLPLSVCLLLKVRIQLFQGSDVSYKRLHSIKLPARPYTEFGKYQWKRKREKKGCNLEYFPMDFTCLSWNGWVKSTWEPKLFYISQSLAQYPAYRIIIDFHWLTRVYTPEKNKGFLLKALLSLLLHHPPPQPPSSGNL